MTLKEILKNIKLSEQTISMVLGAMVVIVMGILVFNYFQNTNKPGTERVTPQPTPTTGVKIIEENGKQVPAGLPTTHKVESGETLWSISEKYFGSGYNWVDIAKENKLVNANRLLVGQELIIPKTEVIIPAVKVENVTQDKQTTTEAISGNTYTVVKGDNLWTIAVRAYQDGYKWSEIAKANKIANPNIIHPGNVLTLPR